MKNLKRVGVQHSKSVVEGIVFWMVKHNFRQVEISAIFPLATEFAKD